jgi:hypothetical protein
MKKIRLLDFAIFLLIVFFGVFYFTQIKQTSQTVIIDLVPTNPDWTTQTINPPYQTVDQIKIGQSVYNSFGNPIAEIVNVSLTPDNGGLQESFLISLKVSVKSSANGKSFAYEGQPLAIGNNFTLNTDHSQLIAKIVGLKPASNPSPVSKHAKITVNYYGQNPWVIESLKKLNYTDNQGKVLLKTLSTSVNPAVEVHPNWLGQLVKTTNPLKKDISITFDLSELSCSQFNCFFINRYPLTLGSPFMTNFNSVQLDTNNYWHPDSSITKIEYYE